MWISVLEDENTLNSLITKYLEKEGYQVRSYSTGEAAVGALSLPTDLWVIDIMLPDVDGFSVFKEVKQYNPDAFVIFISARNQDIDRVVGLELGCDDYIPKPFLVRELVIKVNKLLHAPEHRSEIMELGPYRIAVDKHTVFDADAPVSLTVKEYDLLLYLAANQDNILSRSDILSQVWGYDYYGTDRVVDDTIRRLRRKLPQLAVETVYGLGYRVKRENR